MLPRAGPRPRAGACTLESSLRCLRTSDRRVLRVLCFIIFVFWGVVRVSVRRSTSERPSIDAGKRILKSNDRFLVSGLPRGLAGMPALSACQIVLIYRLQIVYYWSIQRPSVRTSITVTVIDACRRILQSNDQFLVQRKAASRSGGDACTLGSTLGMSDRADISCANRIFVE